MTNLQTSLKSRWPYTTELLALLFVCGFCFFYGLGSFGLVGADEPRYAQIAREMLERHDFVTPRLHGEVWLEKPVLYYWEAALAFKAFGVHDWAARLPSAAFALLMVLGVYFFVRRFHPGAEFDAAILTAVSAAMLGFARGASTDMQLAAPFVLGMLCWYTWHETGRKLWLLAFYFLLAVGTLAKGPVCPGLAVFILVLFAAIRRDAKLILRSISVPGILLYCVVALPWYIAVQLRNPEFFTTFFLQQNLQRFTTNRYQHAQPFWYYGAVLLLCLLPWTVIALPSTYEGLRNTILYWRRNTRTSLQEPGEIHRQTGDKPIDDPLIQLLAVWAIFPVLFFSLSRAKLPGYILPGIPPCTILAGLYLFRRRNAGDTVPRIMALIHALVAGLLAGAVLLLPHFILLPHRMPPTQAVGIAGAVALAIAISLLVGMRRTGFTVIRPFTTLSTVLCVWFILRIAAPSLDAAFSARSVEDYLESLPIREKTVAVYHVRRDVEFGLGFYRNQAIASYDRNEIPQAAHMLLTYKVSEPELAKVLASRHATKLAEYGPQRLGIYWVAP